MFNVIHSLIAVLESKGKVRAKTKSQKKKEEKEKKATVKTQGDELKDNLADNDDSSSTTTETSNPDMETNLKEVRCTQELSCEFSAEENAFLKHTC